MKNSESGATDINSAIDSAAPVITNAAYFSNEFDKPSNDSLSLSFSEDISAITSTEPFVFNRVGVGDYSMNLSLKRYSGNIAFFKVNSIDKVTLPVENDSVRINFTASLSDSKGNSQSVDLNKKVKLKIIHPPFVLECAILPLVNGEEFPSELKINSKIPTGTVITLKPNIFVPDEVIKQVKCKLNIYDAVGNFLIASGGSDDDYLSVSTSKVGDRTEIVIQWGCTNRRGRQVGKGEYLGLFEITYPDGEVSILKKFISTKQ